MCNIKWPIRNSSLSLFILKSLILTIFLTKNYTFYEKNHIYFIHINLIDGVKKEVYAPQSKKLH